MNRALAFSCALLALILAACSAPAPVSAWPKPPEDVYHHAAVAADHPLASQAGLEMLQQGGNAVDAAIAASFTLSVVRPYSCGIGGGGFMIISIPRDDSSGPELIALNYRETAPAAAHPKYYLTFNNPFVSRYGVHAVGVPGTVAGLLHALDTYGTLDRVDVLAPAIRIADHGFPADENHVRESRELAKKFAELPQAQRQAAPVFRKWCRDGDIDVGDVITNPQQARALRLIAEHGAAAFYEGPIAEAIISVMQQNRGPITRDDLAAYRVREMKPLIGDFRGLTIVSMPPPSSGGITMLQILALFDRRANDIEPLQHNSPEYVHLLTECMKHAFADRATFLADSDFIDVPIDRLLDTAYLDDRAAAIDLSHTQPPRTYGSTDSLPDDSGTSHISVLDATGMAVACTETINTVYGSLVLIPEYGFVLNNEMDDFTTIPGRANYFGLQQSDRNLPEPGKRPLSSMSPTIVLDRGKTVLVAGGAGGPRIISGTLQAILNCLLFKMTPAESLSCARFHHQWSPDRLWFEVVWPDVVLLEAMRGCGHRIDRRRDIGKVQIIHADNAQIRAASDPRKGGRPAGY